MKPTYDEIIETIARAICKADGCDPDTTGYAITEETKKQIGESYPLWKARIKHAHYAFHTLQDIMPETQGKVIETYSDGSELVDNSQSNAFELYKHFKTIGRDEL